LTENVALTNKKSGHQEQTLITATHRKRRCADPAECARVRCWGWIRKGSGYHNTKSDRVFLALGGKTIGASTKRHIRAGIIYVYGYAVS
jgi:hypothetical protein